MKPSEVIISENSYRCPFCRGKKKQKYGYNDLLQHARGIGASSSRKPKEKANHRALAEYLRQNPPPKSDPHVRQVVIERERPKPKEEDKFVYPWVGVLVNIPTETKDGRPAGGSGRKLKEEFSRFNPSKVEPLWNRRGHTGNAVVTFRGDWNGFKDAIAFETDFESKHLGKKDWIATKNSNPPMIYGWVARADDHCSNGPVGDYLRKKGDVKTTSEVAKDEIGKAVSRLTNQLEQKSEELVELESRYEETRSSLEKAKQKIEALPQPYNPEEIQSRQCPACGRSPPRQGMDLKRKGLEFPWKQPYEYVTDQDDTDKSEPVAKKKKMGFPNSNLEMEQKKAEEQGL